MATYVMSDIHGEKDRFDEMLKKIGFSSKDELYILGDVIDRGPDGVALLRQIMAKYNIHMLLGNHEDMCLKANAPDATFDDIYRWGRNGSDPTVEALDQLRQKQLDEILLYLQELPTHLELEVGGVKYYLVHAFPGDNVHDEVWFRPAPDTPNPKPDHRVILGHTPVYILERPREEIMAYLQQLQSDGDHVRIYHGENFINLDCGCGHEIPGKALACLRLDDMAEFYL